jgi:ribosome maturation factor RimP
MAKKSISEIVTELALPIVEDAGCELMDVEFIKEGGDWFLRIYIDKTGGVTLDDCEKVSRAVNDILDEKDPIQHAFYLEVSSPGLERQLKKPRDFEKAIGQLVEVKLYKAVGNTKRYEGELVAYDGETLAIKTENDESHQFTMDQIAKVKTLIKF